jgi:hypothetical protein
MTSGLQRSRNGRKIVHLYAKPLTEQRIPDRLDLSRADAVRNARTEIIESKS